MAGDWMKIELELPDKPEVHAMAGILNLDPDAVVGKLIRVWQWFDKHTVDGNAHGVTFSLPDRITNVTGFAEAMLFVGWLEQKDKYLIMPKFDRHTSESAKSRALTNKRVAKSRNAPSVTKALPEKRRVEKNNNIYTPPISKELLSEWLLVRKKKPVTERVFNKIVKEAAKIGWTPEQAIVHCCENSWQGFEASWIKSKDKSLDSYEAIMERALYGK